ncbi:hypothetical protein B0I35DRAFT_179847 [Stachybotrys elegans]|uniref:Heterokaryon incompatibility domain-containing protein n=1 Tax=Stachybotrys elegans TaxID=80388 RepID=A0A8K0SH12_9HYPO|nr:hypothetical protein B0I35DRAFT_179847 [Stachybotrys elegans]
MDHLEEIYSSVVGKVDLKVDLKLSQQQEKDVQKLWNGERFGYREFQQFLADRGWEYTKDDVLKSRTESKDGYGFKQILQAWLFFGLILCILREDTDSDNGASWDCGNDQAEGPDSGYDDSAESSQATRVFDCKSITTPILLLYELILVEGSNKYLNTKKLPFALTRWFNNLKSNPDKAKVRTRLIDADRTLDLARRVVRANLVDGKHRHGSATDNASMGEVDNDQMKLDLCLMVLGETLSAVKAQVILNMDLQINGWLVEDDEGWGPPSYVLCKMQQTRCSHTLRVLQGQLGSSAILMLAALTILPSEERDAGRHEGCTPEVCVEMPGRKATQKNRMGDEFMIMEKGLSYEPQHHESSCSCKEMGPKREKVFNILAGSEEGAGTVDFPLFRIISRVDDNDEDEVLGVTVEPWDKELGSLYRRPSFLAISHVWSQGMGNDRSNSLHQCQLKFLLGLLKLYAGDGPNVMDENRFYQPFIDATLGTTNRKFRLSPPFWLDTLAIPVKGPTIQEKSSEATEIRHLKQKAIRRIYHVYNSASRVLVVDKDLCKEREGLALITGLKILTSPWMRRLWTLQEAFLARSLMVGFFQHLEDFDDLIKKLDEDEKDSDVKVFSMSIAQLVKRKLFHNLMGEDRQIRNRRDHPIETRGSMVIASAWRSSRWRRTTRIEDETLAMSNLLNMDFGSTAIEKGRERIASAKTQSERDECRDEMMMAFWKLIHHNFEGSIPAGFIFLAGEKLRAPGFGWAPTSWMSGVDEDPPYPLSMIGTPTELHPEGLLVQYPGFLLHGGHPNVILSTDLTKASYKFPVDRYLSEWYEVTPIRSIGQDNVPGNFISPFRHSLAPQLAIIMCRSKPGELPKEIGLLVEIYREIWRRKEPRRVNKKIYCCRIIRRIWINRTKPGNGVKDFELPQGHKDEQPIGEPMSEHTMWLIDGRQTPSARRPSIPSTSSRGSSPERPSPVDRKKLLGILRGDSAVDSEQMAPKGQTLPELGGLTTDEIHHSPATPIRKTGKRKGTSKPKGRGGKKVRDNRAIYGQKLIPTAIAQNDQMNQCADTNAKSAV